jgi:hypothetical protein
MPEFKSKVSDADIALTDTLKALFEVLIMRGVVDAAGLDKLLVHQRDSYLEKRMPDAVAVMELLRRFLDDPKRAAEREEIRKLLQAKPQGRG